MQRTLLILVGVILLLLAGGTAVTTPLVLWMLPEVYASQAQIVVEDGSDSRINTELLRIKSSPIIQEAITNLNLTREWGMKYKAPNGTLSMLQTETLFQSELEVERVARTAVVSVRFHSDSREEAARVANEVARVYLRFSDRGVARMLNPAVPQAKPVRPNKPRVMTLAVLLALGLSAAGGFLIVLGVKSGRG